MTIACPSCNVPLPSESVDTPTCVPCPICGKGVRIVTFPAMRVGYVAGRSAEAVQADGEASCFYHAGKRAAVACDGCGRFLCSLCDVEVGSRHLCPSCVEAAMSPARAKEGRAGPGGAAADQRRFLYDSLAVALAVWPVILAWPFTILTAPGVLYIAARYWGAPGGMFRRTKARLCVAAALAAAQLAGWAVGFYYLLFVA
jgi:hypothetical protein